MRVSGKMFKAAINEDLEKIASCRVGYTDAVLAITPHDDSASLRIQRALFAMGHEWSSTLMPAASLRSGVRSLYIRPLPAILTLALGQTAEYVKMRYPNTRYIVLPITDVWSRLSNFEYDKED